MNVRFSRTIPALIWSVSVLACASGTGPVPNTGKTVSLDLSHSTAIQCLELAQELADEKRYAEAADTLRECEDTYGATVDYIPAFSDQDE